MLRDIGVGPLARLAGAMEQTETLRPLARARDLSFSSLKGNLGQNGSGSCSNNRHQLTRRRCYP